MEDFYKDLDIEQGWSSEQIADHLMRLNKEYRQRTRHRDSGIREEANQKLQQINRAMTRLGPEGDRAVYDQELAGFRAAQELQRPLADVNLYQMFQLPLTATEQQIEAALVSAETPGTAASQTADATARQVKMVALARHVLLDPQRRQEYDVQLREKLAFEAQRDAVKPVALHVNGTDVTDWVQLESVIDQNPEEGLFLLQDGEIEAWVRWSLGQPLRANWVREIGNRAHRSDTPYMELDQLQRLVNGNRPLLVYRVGEGPSHGAVARIGQVADIPVLADRNWPTFVDQLGYVLDWISVYGDEKVMARLNAYPSSDDTDKQLERLLACIDPHITAPQAEVSGTTNGVLDFGSISNWESPTATLEIEHRGRGYLYGQVSATKRWITLDCEEFSGPSTTIRVGIDRTLLPTGVDNEGHLRLTFLDDRVPALVVPVTVSKRTAFQSVKGLFGRKG